MVNPVVDATTVGFIPSSNNNGLMTIPPPIPSIPAKVPASIDHLDTWKILIILASSSFYSPFSSKTGALLEILTSDGWNT